jgi:hypothetical protein
MACGSRKADSSNTTANVPPPTTEEVGGWSLSGEDEQQSLKHSTFDDFIYMIFGDDGYYTLLFDNEAELDMGGDSLFTSAQVEWIDLKSRIMQRHSYELTEGSWQLKDSTSVYITPPASGNDFLSFYARFVTDSVYQYRHIHEPLVYVTIDPDDEFSILETTLDRDGWHAFKPSLPVGRLSNINYGQLNRPDSPTKIIKINGIGDGYSNLFYFRKQNGRWELYKYEDTSV